MDGIRPSKKDYYLSIARDVAKRSTCLRRQYGAVIVKNDEIVSTGYNGAPRGRRNCCDAGACWREENGIPHGQMQEMCRAVHAEENAIISASRERMIDSDLYLFGMEGDDILKNPEPCLQCKRRIINAGIRRVITPDKVFDTDDFCLEE